MSEWVSVEYKLPKNGETVLCTGHEYNDKTKPRWQMVSLFSNGFKHYIHQSDSWSDDCTNYVTHWQPRPDDPK